MAVTISGQKTVTAHGTAEQLHTGLQAGVVMIKALPANTDVVYIGNVSGDVDSSNGMPLSAGDACIINGVVDLSNIWVDSAVDGEGVAWLLLDISPYG